MSKKIVWPKRLDYSGKLAPVMGSRLIDQELTPGNFYICLFAGYKRARWYHQVCRCTSFNSLKFDVCGGGGKGFHEYNMQVHTGERARCFWGGFFIPLDREERKLLRVVKQL